MKEKIIQLKDRNDTITFEKNIWKYKSILYKNTKFVLENKTGEDGYQDIIDALNIKNRLKRITYIYDKACKQIDDYNDKNNITCEFKNGKCCAHYQTNHYNGCCRMCKYQSQNGCKTSNLSCKLFFCGCVQSKHKILRFEDIKVLKCFSKREKAIANINFFSSRKMFITTLYTSSFILVTIFDIINILMMLPSLIKKQKIAKKYYENQ